MKNCYINGVSCISAQKVSENGFFEDIQINNSNIILPAQEPSYKDSIPAAAARRMAKGVKMGIYASTQALKEAGVTVPDAIITGTGMGCLKDSEKFLKALIDNDEQFLTPTSFIQSTHNTVGGQIALGLQCNGYNFTYVNGAISFESALVDAKLLLENEEENSILIGGVDEMADHTINQYKLVHLVKKEEDLPFDVLHPNSKGIVHGEGAGFFVVENQKKDSTYAQVIDVALINSIELSETSSFVTSFLEKNKIAFSEIDVVVLGNNGDIEYDNYYEAVSDLFKQTPQAYYKHLTGEFNTVSSIAFWLGAKILKNQVLISEIQKNKLTKEVYKTVLIYNQYQGKDHSLTLLKRC